MDKVWMQRALELAALGKTDNEVPVGAVLVLNGECIAQAHNQVRSRFDPTAHAEIQVIRQACATLQNERLPGATLYVTLEPCAMCMGALLHARVDRLVFGTRDFRAGAAGSKINLAQGLGAYPSIQVDEGVCQKECEVLLKDFFQLLRSNTESLRSGSEPRT